MADKEKFGPMEAERGEALFNTCPEGNYTCPGCHADHEGPTGERENAEFLRCECGAPLRLEVEMVPNFRCTIADEDEEEEELPKDNGNDTGFVSFNDTMS